MSPASRGAHLSQIGRTVALLSSHASFGDLVALMKPRVMSLVVFTALVGVIGWAWSPPSTHRLRHASLHYRGRRRRGRAQHVVRRRYRPIDDPYRQASDSARPYIARRSARVRAGSCGVFYCRPAFCGQPAAAALLAFTILFYVVVYTMWLKRQTPQNIVVGGAAGAFPPVIGWVAATGRIGWSRSFCS
jgi:heme o synthase